MRRTEKIDLFFCNKLSRIAYSMTLSEQTQSVLAYFDKYSGFNLRKKNDIGEILEIASVVGAAEEFNALVFAGKIVWNLYSTLRKITSEQDGYRNVEHEFAAAVQTMRECLSFFALESDDDALKQRFEEVYLGVSQGTMRNLVDLAHDLSRFKDLQGDEQRKAGE